MVAVVGKLGSLCGVAVVEIVAMLGSVSLCAVAVVAMRW